jgi:hypothetical protein
MREMVEKSIQLNRELNSLLIRALESNKAIKLAGGEEMTPNPEMVRWVLLHIFQLGREFAY